MFFIGFGDERSGLGFCVGSFMKFRGGVSFLVGFFFRLDWVLFELLVFFSGMGFCGVYLRVKCVYICEFC